MNAGAFCNLSLRTGAGIIWPTVTATLFDEVAALNGAPKLALDVVDFRFGPVSGAHELRNVTRRHQLSPLRFKMGERLVRHFEDWRDAVRLSLFPFWLGLNGGDQAGDHISERLRPTIFVRQEVWQRLCRDLKRFIASDKRRVFGLKSFNRDSDFLSPPCDLAAALGKAMENLLMLGHEPRLSDSHLSRQSHSPISGVEITVVHIRG